ncbi:MAG TPA: DUF58 domain-containing protein [Bacillota bacterium]|nr:DUF58 domain-containing protein [Bacillota bacterium]
MIPVPRVRFILLFFIPLFCFVASFKWEAFYYWAIGCNALLIMAAIFDILATVPNLRYDLVSEKVKPFSIGRINTLSFKLLNLTRTPQTLAVKISLPKWFEDQTPEQWIELKGLAENQITFLLRPTRRGSFPVEFVYFRVNSKFGLFYFDQKRAVDLTIEVYPDLKQLNHFLKLTRNNRDYKMGINKTRWMGNGAELESLREYQKDDDSKFIDWKASTRLNRPISKVFQMETNNQITIALDCGRLMTAEQKGLNTLDHAINSLLILSHIAFNAGDSLNIVAFSDKIIAKTPSLKGRDSLKKITQFVTKLKPEFVESNYSLLFNYLEQTQKKRALIIIITDMIDDINYELFKKRINWLSRKHFVLFILMQDSLLSGHANQETSHGDDFYVKTAGREMLLQRNKAISKLKQHRINVIDVLPHELTGPLINKYLELKSRNRL